MISKFGSISAVVLIAVGLFPLSVFAQTPTNQPEVVGLKIGMTFDQADAALNKYNSNIKIIPLYRYADTTSDLVQWPNPQADIQQMSGPGGSMPNKVKVQVEQFAGILTHTFDSNGNVITDENSDDVNSVSGEWFDLLFTPSDSGGRLYAILRTVVYPRSSFGTSDATTLQNNLLAKYAEPSSSATYGNSWEGTWMYDARARQIPTSNPDYARCTVQIPTDLSADYGFADNVGAPTLKDYNEVFSGISGATLDADDQNRLSALFTQIYSFVPSIQAPTDSQAKLQYRNCGIQLAVFIDPGDSSDTSARFVTTLSDQNATYYDNGIDKYLTAKLLAVNGPPPATQQPGL